jgi:hypothetical protein
MFAVIYLCFCPFLVMRVFDMHNILFNFLELGISLVDYLLIAEMHAIGIRY